MSWSRISGRRCPPGLGTCQGTEGVEDLLPRAVPVPLLEVVVDGLPGREVVRQGPPGTPFAGMIEQSVDDLAQLGLARPAGPTPSAYSGQQRLDQGPLLVCDITRVGFPLHAALYVGPVFRNTWGVNCCSIWEQTLRDSGTSRRSKKKARFHPGGCASWKSKWLNSRSHDEPPNDPE